MWWDTNNTYIWLFNTGRGLSVIIRLPHNVGIIYDLGCSDEFSPIDFLTKNIIPHLTEYQEYKNNKIGQLILSHPHLDHIQEIDSFLEIENDKPAIYPGLVTCPNDKEEGELKIKMSRILRDDNKDLIEKYKKIYESRTPPLQTMVGLTSPYPEENVEYGIYYLNPARVEELHQNDDHAYVNGLSIILYLRHGNQSILIPGDITPEVFSEIIDGGKNVQKRYTYFDKKPSGASENLYKENGNQRNLKTLLSDRGLSILISPHHGLESCFCPYLFENMKAHKPCLNVISEKRHLSEGDGKVDNRYQSADFSLGMKVDIDETHEEHYSVSTRNNQHILIIFNGTDDTPLVCLRTDPEDLLNIDQ